MNELNIFKIQTNVKVNDNEIKNIILTSEK